MVEATLARIDAKLADLSPSDEPGDDQRTMIDHHDRIRHVYRLCNSVTTSDLSDTLMLSDYYSIA